MTATLPDLLQETIQRNGSDLHLAAGAPPYIRVDGVLQALDAGPLTDEHLRRLCLPLLTESQQKAFAQTNELDFSFDLGTQHRVRANLFKQQGKLAAAFRTIPRAIPSPAELQLPETLGALMQKPHGLILVTGPTGSGKSTTLASLINELNRTAALHIVTVEDPIEYVYTPIKAKISQRSVGHDTASFGEALKHVLRQDPDVVLIGEMRDLETIQSAITIAETGHLVLATLHTNTAAETIDRTVDVFPAHQQPQIRTQLSMILQGVVCQQLVPKIDGGRTVAVELLIPNHAIRNLIRDNKTHQIYAQMQVGQAESQMQTMTQALVKLVRAKVVAQPTALQFASDPAEFTAALAR